jgi:purine-binding chemotaxis protein CheW
MSSELPEEVVEVEDEFEIDTDLGSLGGIGEEEEVDEEPAEEQTQEPQEKFVRFTVGGDVFTVHVDAVRRIVDMEDITRVPRTSQSIDGIIDLRGEITAVIDPRTLFHVDELSAEDSEQEVIVFEMGVYGGHAGIRIDNVEGVDSVGYSDILFDEEGLSEESPLVSLFENELFAAVVRQTADDGTTRHDPVLDVTSIIELSRQSVTA